MMNLMEYLYETQQTITDFGKKIGYKPGSLSNVLHGRTKPSPRLMYLVKMQTQGRVTKIEI